MPPSRMLSSKGPTGVASGSAAFRIEWARSSEGERQLCKLDVAGSIPAGSTILPLYLGSCMSLDTRDFQDAIIVRNVVARAKRAKAFPSQEALEKYLKEHPNADKSKHHVEDEETSKLKKDLKDFQKIEKGQEKAKQKREKRKEEKGKKEDDAHAEKLKKELLDWKNAK